MRWTFLALSLGLAGAIHAQTAADIAAAPSSAWDGGAFALAPAEAMEAAKSLTGGEGDDAVYALESDSYTYEENGSAVYAKRVVYKILIAKGVDRRDTASCSYQPWRQDKPEIRARVIGKDGKVYDLDPSTIAEQTPDEGNDVYTDARTLYAPLPGLEAGSLVEYEIILRDRAPLLEAGRATRSWFGRQAPILKRVLAVDCPASMPLRYQLRGPGSSGISARVAEAGGRKRLECLASSLANVGETEDYIPSEAVPVACVDVSTARSWQAVAQAYAAIAEPAIGSGSAAAFAASAIESAHPGRAGRIGAVLDKMRKEIRYTGINFGDNAIIPHAPSDTIARGYGDCKDQAGLLAAALRSIGIEASLALLDSGYGSDILESLPGFGLFDHAIVYLPEDRTWIDPIAAYYRAGELPAMDRGRLALIVSAGTTGLLRTPDCACSDNTYRELRSWTLAEVGSASVRESTTLTGIIEADYRGHYASSDPKSLREQLEKYVKSAYAADKLDEFKYSEVGDPESSFRLDIAASSAKRGFTERSSAYVILQSGSLLDFLPRFLREKEEGSEEAPRKNDVRLDIPYVAELEYRISPPPGFKAAALPEPLRREMGPALLEGSFRLEEDGSAVALFRFDCRASSYSPEEAKSLREAVVAYMEEDAPSISFEQVGEALLSAGKYAEALNEMRALEALHPAEALHKIQASSVLAAAGFGDAARAEAREAVKLEPSSAAARAQLAWTLILGPFGRPFEPGCDLAAASAEYGEAAKLDPDEPMYTANRAIIAEYGIDLRRWGKGARLDEAAAIYAGMPKDKLKAGGWENNLPIDLLKLRRFAELKEAARGGTGNKYGKALFVAATTAVDGTAAALREAAKLSAAADERGEVLSLAGTYLIIGRRYAEAAELVTAGARGSKSQTQALALASSLRKVKAVDPGALSRDEPLGITVAFIYQLLAGDCGSASLEPLFASSLWPTLEAGTDEWNRAIASMVSGNSLEDYPAEVIVDLIVGQCKVDTISSGPAIAALLYFPAQPSYEPKPVYLTREGQGLKIVDAQDGLKGIAREVIARLDAGEIDKARAWFTLIADQHKRDNRLHSFADTPAIKLLGDPASADAEGLRLSASLILASSRSKLDRDLAMPAILAAMKKPGSSYWVTTIARTAATGLLLQGRGAEAAKAAQKLVDASRKEEDSIMLLISCLDAAGESSRADAVVAQAIAANPRSTALKRAAIEHEIRNGRYETALRRLTELLDSGEGSRADYNQYAWYSLYLPKPDYAPLEGRQIVQRLMSGGGGELHTVACVLADSGRLIEAQEALGKYLDTEGSERPAAAWLALGIYAERFGLRDLAIDAYRRVERSDNWYEKNSSCWDLAKLHLERMGAK